MNNFSKQTCLSSILLFLMGFVSLNAVQAQSWMRDTVSVGNYTIMMPENSQRQVQQINSDAVKLDVHLYAYEDENSGYLVSYIEYPWSLINGRSEDEIFDGAINGMLNSVKGELIDRAPIIYEGYSGVESTLTLDDQVNAKVRLYIIENRLYQLAVFGDNSTLTNKNTALFFSSFEVLDLETIETTLVERLLNELGYNVMIDEDNDYNIILEFDDGRSQVVYITPTISTLTASEKYEIWSIVGVYDDLPARELAGNMFLSNGKTEIGQFQSFETDSGFLLAYSALFHGDLNADILESLIVEVASISDDFEIQLMGDDPY